ncbi:MAG TPA: cytochrome D1 domain-containing protein [Thermoanaerobaculia bacterium]|nr:cytochrome D1 domain-containing protein [Thermoanaerobaculia bacterium]
MPPFNLRFALVAACSTLAAAAAPLEAAEILYVHNTNSGQISKVAIPEHEVVGEIPIGLYMDFVTASPDGRVLYVNRIESLGEGRAANIGVSGELIAVSTLTDEILWRVPIDGMTHHMTVSKDGRHVFVPLYDTWWVAVVDTEQRAVVKKIFFGHGGHGSKLSADGRRLYVGSMMNDHIGIIDTETLEMIDRIGFPDGVRPFALTRDESRMYVQLSRTHGFAVVDPRERRLLRMVPMPTLGKQVEGDAFYPHNVNHGIALTPDETLLFANGSAIDVVSVFSHPELEHVKSIPVGRDPNSIAFSKDGRFAYVTNRRENTLSILDVGKLEEVKRLTLGDLPQRMVVVEVPAE